MRIVDEFRYCLDRGTGGLRITQFCDDLRFLMTAVPPSDAPVYFVNMFSTSVSGVLLNVEEILVTHESSEVLSVALCDAG